ncbi:MAG TPA: ATP phosphoribosyltransferase regulatory subunit [Clostridiaceae bacterium]
MNKWKRYIPEGTRDILFEDCENRSYIEEKLRELYRKNGYNQVISPTLEYYDVFSGEYQPLPQEKMFKLFDNNGRILVLRPDMTTPIGRIAATKLKTQPLPLKLCYNASIYRINEDWNGRFSEISQSGIEIVGIKGSRADAEAISIGIKALEEVGLEDYKIEIGQAEFFKTLMDETKLTQDEKEALRRIVEHKNFTSLREFLAENSENIEDDAMDILGKLPELFGTIEVLDYARKLTKNKKALQALESIQEVYDLLEKRGFASHIVIDLAMVQHIYYYTGTIFRGYSSEVGEYILSGGRYDNLIGQFGEELPSTGLALNIDNIMLALKKQGKYTPRNNANFLLYYEDSNIGRSKILTSKLLDLGFVCEQSLFTNEEETRSYQQAKGIINLIIFGKAEDLIIYNMNTKKEKTIDQREFLEFIGGKHEID